MVNEITVNGSLVQVLNTLSYGPGESVHTYELKGGSYVYEISGSWFIQERGQLKRRVEIGL